MATEVSYAKVPVFNGKNFGLWKKQVTIVLKTKDLLEVLTPVEEAKRDAAWSKKDNEVQALLFTSLEQSVALKVVSCGSAAEIWNRLKEVYESNTAAAVAKVYEEYYSYRKSSGDDMATHVSKVEALANQLETLGEKQTDVSIMSRLLHSLPASYDALKEAWESVESAKQTKTALVSRLLAHAPKEGSSTKDEALISESRADDSRQGRDNKQYKRKGKCYNCGKFGHWSKDCRVKKTIQETNANTVGLVAVDSEERCNQWVVDSGATKHTCCRKEWFTTSQPWEEMLKVGNNATMKSKAKGTIELLCSYGSGLRKITLNDVLYFPDMRYNLFSTTRAAMRGAITTLDNRGCTVKIGGDLVARGLLTPIGLCVLDVKTVNGIAMIAMDQRTQHDWHRALGHADNQVVSEMAANKSATGMEITQTKEEGCGSCPEGKATRASHTMQSSFVPSEVGERVDMDLIGPIAEESLSKKRYILLAKDSYSDYSHIFFLNNKTEVAEKLQHYISEFESESNRRIKMIMTDNGSEFANNRVQTICDLEHIKLCFSAAYTPEQNGTAERNNRTIIETTRTILADSRLPKALWAEAANTAVYLRNRVAKRGSKLTPYEKFWGRKPYIGHIIPFGTEVQALTVDRKIGKFDPKTEPAYVVGFTERANNYRLLIKNTMRVRISCDVIFRPHAKIDKADTAPSDSEVVIISNAVCNDKMNQGQRSELLNEYFEDLLQRIRGSVSASIIDSIRTEQQTRNEQFLTPTAPSVMDIQHEDSEIASPSFSTISGLSPARNLFNVPPTTPTRSSSLLNTPLQTHRQHSPSCIQNRELPKTPPPPVQQTPAPSAASTSGDIRETQTNPIVRMVTRSISKHKGDLLVAASIGTLTDEPTTLDQALSGPNKESWKMAVAAELKAHERNQTWRIVPRPRAGTLLTAKWVFKMKRDKNGDVEKYKARLVARGFQQREGIDYTETYAPVARSESIRVLLALAAIGDLHVERFDISTAFLYGKIDEEVYLEPPDGIEVEPNKCFKLEKALYGLKQAPKAWNSAFDAVIKQIGFDNIDTDHCVYHHIDQSMHLAIYVDDGLIIGPSRHKCLEIMERLNDHFATNRVEGEIFLGMQVQVKEAGIHLSQSRYIQDLLAKNKMSDCTGVSTPLADAKILFEREGDIRADVPYRSAIGGLLYTALATRPDILFPTILLSKFNEAPQTKHWAAVKRIMRYLSSTKDFGLLFRRGKRDIELKAFSDADWAGDLQNRKSTSGIIILLSGSPVIFASRQQTTVALSSTEAELVAACDAAKELLWLMNFLTDLGIVYGTPTLYVDNMSTIALIKNNETKRRSKHIDVKYHFVRKLYQDGMFKIDHVGSKEQLADYLTKAIGVQQFEKLLDLSGIVRAHAVGFEGECRRKQLQLCALEDASSEPEGRGRELEGECTLRPNAQQ